MKKQKRRRGFPPCGENPEMNDPFIGSYPKFLAELRSDKTLRGAQSTFNQVINGKPRVKLRRKMVWTKFDAWAYYQAKLEGVPLFFREDSTLYPNSIAPFASNPPPSDDEWDLKREPSVYIQCTADRYEGVRLDPQPDGLFKATFMQTRDFANMIRSDGPPAPPGSVAGDDWPGPHWRNDKSYWRSDK